jgi:hypothetical protein
VGADGFQGLYKTTVPYTIINFLFASLKLLTNFCQMLTEIILRILFFVINRCSLVATSHWLQEA